MTDDLVKRLREDEITVTLCHIAAARIEEIEEALFFIWKSKTLFDAQIKARTVLKGEKK